MFDSCEPCSPKGDRFVDTSLSTLIGHHEAFRRQAVRYHSAGIVEFNGALQLQWNFSQEQTPCFSAQGAQEGNLHSHDIVNSKQTSDTFLRNQRVPISIYISIYIYTASIYSFYGISAKTSELRSCVKVEVDVDDELMLNVLRCHETY